MNPSPRSSGPPSVLSKQSTPTSSQASTSPEHNNLHEKGIDWNDPTNIHNPFNWPDTKKWRVTLLASFMTFVIQVNGTMMTSAAQQINKSFHISDEAFPHSYWPVLSWNLGGAAAPMIGLPLMERSGVRKSYLVICNHVAVNIASANG